jgi:TolB protein
MATLLSGGCGSSGGGEGGASGSTGFTIAFHSDRDGNDEIYVMNADGSGQMRLTNDAAPSFPLR